MCIRDRKRRPEHRTRPALQASECPDRPRLCVRRPVPLLPTDGVRRGLQSDQGPHRAGRARRPLLCCLLYTSDAADDLLCVDLGGRRIIKKKKKEKRKKKKKRR